MSDLCASVGTRLLRPVGSGLSHPERAALAQRLADEVLAILEAPRD